MIDRWLRLAALIALVLITADIARSQGYGGPSMLSRGGNRPGQRGRAPVDLVVYGAVRGTLETGLTPVRLQQPDVDEADVEDPDTELVGEPDRVAKDKRYGVQAEIGAYGTHSWRTTVLGVDYRGDYRKSSPRRRYQGTNQALSVDVYHQINRRAAVFFRETGGTTNRAFGGFVAPSVPDPNSFNVPNDELFDTRIYFSQTAAGLTYRTSARMSYVATADYFFTIRSENLIGVSGYRVAGAGSYNLSSRSTIGLQYQHMEFIFKRISGDSSIDIATLTFSRRFTRNTTVNVAAGPAYVRSTGVQQVQLTPEVAAILGRTSGVAAFRRNTVVPYFTGLVTYSLERSRFTGAFMSQVTPGNGAFVTSRLDSASAGYSFTGVRKLSMGASARVARRQSLSIAIREPMVMMSGGGGVSYRLTSHLDLSSQVDYRKYRTGGLLGREGFFVAIGLSVSPARIPVSIW